MKSEDEQAHQNPRQPDGCPNNTAAVAGKTTVLGVCGWSGAGKTTLIEDVLPRLKGLGLRVLVAKHEVHTIEIDPRGKDSARIFDAGADVILTGRAQQMWRKHLDGSPALLDELRELSGDYDIILVEGHKDLPIQKVWLLGPEKTPPPPDCTQIISTLKRGAGRAETFMTILRERLAI